MPYDLTLIYLPQDLKVNPGEPVLFFYNSRYPDFIIDTKEIGNGGSPKRKPVQINKNRMPYNSRDAPFIVHSPVIAIPSEQEPSISTLWRNLRVLAYAKLQNNWTNPYKIKANFVGDEAVIRKGLESIKGFEFSLTPKEHKDKQFYLRHIETNPLRIGAFLKFWGKYYKVNYR